MNISVYDVHYNWKISTHRLWTLKKKKHYELSCWMLREILKKTREIENEDA